jgi:hypothetical protein
MEIIKHSGNEPRQNSSSFSGPDFYDFSLQLMQTYNYVFENSEFFFKF